jgi:hypothetical protein
LAATRNDGLGERFHCCGPGRRCGPVSGPVEDAALLA